VKKIFFTFKSWLLLHLYHNYITNKNIFNAALTLLLGLINSWVFLEPLTSFLLGGKSFSGRNFLFRTVIFLAIFCTISCLIYFLLTSLEKLLKINNPYYLFLTLNFWAIILFFVPRGFDITDNGYYLLMAHRYEDVSFELTLFGLITRIMYFLVGGSVSSLRILGALIILISALFAGWTTGNVLKTSGSNQNVFILYAPAITAAMYYHQWLSTPSYNWLALIASLWFYSGIMLLLDKSRKIDYIKSGLVIGVSGILAFLAKPTTAAMFLLILLLVVFIEKINIRS
jgi:hypothetical protein